mmetsp:Transcript_66470/g.191883  ORF Transcript_66470/g.191883 Transcript_66470/m.191883 type:complete len:205 (+) Transcript_66470:41-655(+)
MAIWCLQHKCHHLGNQHHPWQNHRRPTRMHRRSAPAMAVLELRLPILRLVGTTRRPSRHLPVCNLQVWKPVLLPAAISPPSAFHKIYGMFMRTVMPALFTLPIPWSDTDRSRWPMEVNDATMLLICTFSRPRPLRLCWNLSCQANSPRIPKACGLSPVRDITWVPKRTKKEEAPWNGPSSNGCKNKDILWLEEKIAMDWAEPCW